METAEEVVLYAMLPSWCLYLVLCRHKMVISKNIDVTDLTPCDLSCL